MQGLGLGAKHLPNVPPASQPWDLRARWQFHLNLPSRNLAFLCILFLCVLKKSKCKNTEQASSKIPCFSLRKSRVRPKCVSSSRLSKYWPLSTDQLKQDRFASKPHAAQLYHFLGMSWSKLFKFLIKIWRNKSKCQSMHLISFAMLR